MQALCSRGYNYTDEKSCTWRKKGTPQTTTAAGSSQKRCGAWKNRNECNTLCKKGSFIYEQFEQHIHLQPKDSEEEHIAKRNASQQQASRQLEQKQPDPRDKGKKMESASKKRKTETTTETRESSPDMVEEILWWQAPSGRGTEEKQNTRTEVKEDTRNRKTTPSGNTKGDQKEEVSKKEEKQRVPPPASARVDESKIDDVAVAKLEAAKRTQQNATADSIWKRRQTDGGKRREDCADLHQ